MVGPTPGPDWVGLAVLRPQLRLLGFRDPAQPVGVCVVGQVGQLDLKRLVVGPDAAVVVVIGGVFTTGEHTTQSMTSLGMPCVIRSSVVRLY